MMLRSDASSPRRRPASSSGSISLHETDVGLASEGSGGVGTGLRVPSVSGTATGTRSVDIDQGGELVMAGVSY